MEKQILLADKTFLSRDTSLKQILDTIAIFREQKGKEEKTLEIIKQAIIYGHNFIVDLYWEEALLYQHQFMIESNKPLIRQNKKLMSKAINKMEKVVNKAGYYIFKYKLTHWYSRLNRFLGRICDYKGDYVGSAIFYLKAIKQSKKDPDYLEKGYPRWLELEGFLSFSLIMMGKEKEGLKKATKTYEKFEKTKEGKELREKDYTTWAIWRSGIALRVVEAFLSRKSNIKNKDLAIWLDMAEKDISPQKETKTWSDFKMRRDEIENLRRKILVD
jgi:tetratricopeptide (TPR) repeat protein